MWCSRDDRGQATPLLAAVVGVAVVLMLALAPMAQAVVSRAQARTAADAAALAGAAEGEDRAAELAAANGGELLGYEAGNGEVVVKVRVGETTAYARAKRTERERPPGAPAAGQPAGLAPAMVAALARAETLLGRPVPVVSGFRSREQQEALWERRGSNRYPVARPGYSMHERGLAIDVPRAFVADLLEIAPEIGLCQPLPASDPVHFEVCGAR